MHVTSDDTGNYIICEGARIPIEWDKVVNIHDESAKVLPPKNYRRYKKNARCPRMIITHYDSYEEWNSAFQGWYFGENVAYIKTLLLPTDTAITIELLF